ncbi:hypothetical protein FOG18_05745 [Legionella israelensis]|uniref:hypothetical protein n=1 Tax=Legionella israelensis TaxID=454 RepID=UPI00117F1222|nr:hypothetical protein [Legionella israelensis]QDP72105.1 hypothetical protein FOG18_05745 [Legionella israelensis]
MAVFYTASKIVEITNFIVEETREQNEEAQPKQEDSSSTAIETIHHAVTRVHKGYAIYCDPMSLALNPDFDRDVAYYYQNIRNLDIPSAIYLSLGALSAYTGIKWITDNEKLLKTILGSGLLGAGVNVSALAASGPATVKDFISYLSCAFTGGVTGLISGGISQGTEFFKDKIAKEASNAALKKFIIHMFGGTAGSVGSFLGSTVISNKIQGDAWLNNIDLRQLAISVISGLVNSGLNYGFESELLKDRLEKLIFAQSLNGLVDVNRLRILKKANLGALTGGVSSVLSAFSVNVADKHIFGNQDRAYTDELTSSVLISSLIGALMAIVRESKLIHTEEIQQLIEEKISQTLETESTTSSSTEENVIELSKDSETDTTKSMKQPIENPELARFKSELDHFLNLAIKKGYRFKLGEVIRKQDKGFILEKLVKQSGR